MKKVILSVVLILGIGVAANAHIQNRDHIQQDQKTVSAQQPQNDGFKEVKFEELNEKVQAAVRIVAESYEINSLQYNKEKQITKVEATKKDDQSKKTFYFDVDGNEIIMDADPIQPEKVEEWEDEDAK